MKRIVDIALSLAALLLLSPLLLLVACAIFVDSGFPVFFSQMRVGRKGQIFRLFKFRSMQRDASSAGPHFTRSGDTRVTRVGRFIRRTSMDELPQILNVLIGNMSLVGPRPAVPLQEAMYDPKDWAMRCSVLPGITGLAQVGGRSSLTFEEQLALDLRYVLFRTVSMDIRIIWATLCQLRGRHSN